MKKKRSEKFADKKRRAAARILEHLTVDTEYAARRTYTIFAIAKCTSHSMTLTSYREKNTLCSRTFLASPQKSSRRSLRNRDVRFVCVNGFVIRAMRFRERAHVSYLYSYPNRGRLHYASS